MSIDVTFSGPIFDGRAEQALKDGVKAVRRQVAREGEKLTRAVFTSSIRVNTGRFLGSVTTAEESQTYSTDGYTMAVTVGNDEDIVTTSNAAYGPWLEGVGSRNETTRFKGYFGFRIAGQVLDGRAQGIAERAIAPYVEAMNR